MQGPRLATAAPGTAAGRNPHRMIESNGLRAAIKSLGGDMKDAAVLARINDPFFVDTPARHRDGEWLATALDDLGLSRAHLRGLHYRLIERTKPNGLPYTNTFADWAWLLAHPAKAARWLGYIGFDRITDERNAEPVVRLWTPPEPKGYVSTYSEIYLPDADDLTPKATLDDFVGIQPYHLVLVGEKSSLRDVLEPIADEYEADLYLPNGEISDTQIHDMASHAVRDGRPMAVFDFSDCDPSGWQMPISLSRKLQALRVIEYTDLEFAVYRVGLLPDQVRMYGLPSTPLKDGEKRAPEWERAQGVQQTEVDAMLALRPELLRETVIDAISKFYDHDLADRVAAVRSDWLRRTQAVIDEQTDATGITDAVAQIDRKGEEIDAILDTIATDDDDFEKPPLPAIPAANIDLEAQPMALCDSRWSFETQTEMLILSRDYELDDE
jgi:hypothetical protein